MTKTHRIADIGRSWTRNYIRMPDNKHYRTKTADPIVLDGKIIPWVNHQPLQEPMTEYILLTAPSEKQKEFKDYLVFVVKIPWENDSSVCRPHLPALGFTSQPFIFPIIRNGGIWTPVMYRMVAPNYFFTYQDELRRMLSSHPDQLAVLDKLFAEKGLETANDWCVLVIMTSLMHPHPDDHPKLMRRMFYGELPGLSSVLRAMKHVLGPRGMVAGWPGPLPPLAYNMLTTPTKVPKRLFPDPMSDGSSDWDPLSPCAGDSENEVFRPGITCSLLQDSDSTTSESAGEAKKRPKRLRSHMGKILLTPFQQRDKTFKSYTKTFYHGTRIRKLFRGMRREMREKLIVMGRHISERKLKRIVMDCGHEAVSAYMEKWFWQIDKSRFLKMRRRIGRQLSQLQKLKVKDSEEPKSLIGQLVSLRLLYIRLSLREHILEKWKCLYSVTTEEPLELYCWMSTIQSSRHEPDSW